MNGASVACPECGGSGRSSRAERRSGIKRCWTCCGLGLVPELSVEGFNSFTPSSRVLTECLFCPAMIGPSTGLEGVREMEAAGWEAVAGGDWTCPKCSESRADLIGEER